jgi:hypothetical protein
MSAVERPSRRTALTALGLATASAACQNFGFYGPTATFDELAERYVTLTLATAQHQPSLVEARPGAKAQRAAPRRPVREILPEVGELTASLRDASFFAEKSHRWRYLEGQVRALDLAVRRLAGESTRLADEARQMLGTEWPGPADATRVAAARAELEQRLGGADLVARLAHHRRTRALAPERVLPAFVRAVQYCRERVRRVVVMPDGEQVEASEAHKMGVEARAEYRGNFTTAVAVDRDGGIDLARLVWLAAHEAYPGHHVQHVLADRDVHGTRGWVERGLAPAFGPHLFFSEGAAEAGAELLLEGDSFAEACHAMAAPAGIAGDTIDTAVAVHRAVAELDATIPTIAEAYLDGAISGELAKERLGAEALVADAAGMLSVIERQRSRVLAYPIGRRVVGRALADVPAESRWPRLAAIATHLQL